MACLANETLTDFGCVPNNPIGFVQKFYGVGLGIIGGVGLLGILYSGYLILTSRGDPVQLEKGKRYLASSITGVLLVLFAVFYVQTIAVGIIGIPGFH
jgi:hypothetical protein